MRTNVSEKRIVSVSPLGPITLVLFAAICLTWPGSSLTKVANGLLYQMNLAELGSVRKAAAALESIASASFSPVDYLPVLEYELESLAQKPQFMRQVLEQVQADLESASVADDLKFDSVLPVTSSESAEVTALRFVASSVAVVCHNVKQIRNDHGLILAEYYSDHSGPETKGYAVYYWSCHQPR